MEREKKNNSVPVKILITISGKPVFTESTVIVMPDIVDCNIQRIIQRIREGSLLTLLLYLIPKVQKATDQ